MKSLSIRFRDEVRQKGKILLVKYLYHLCTRFLLNSLEGWKKFVRLRSWNWRNLYCRANILIMVNCWNSLYRFSNRTRKFAAFIPKHGNERLILHRITIFFSNALRKKDAQLTSYRPQNFPKYRFFDSPSTSNTISHLQNFFHRLIKKEKEKKERSISRNIAQRSETLVKNWRRPRRRGIVSSYLEEKRFWERRRGRTVRKKKRRRRNAALRGTFPSSLG